MIPDPNTMLLPVLQALAAGRMRDFRAIHADVKWKLGFPAADVERLLPSGRTEVSYGLSVALQYMIERGLVTNPARAHYQITDAGRQRLELVSHDSRGITIG